MMGYLYQVGKAYYYGVKDGRRWIRRSARTRYKQVAEARMRQAELRLAQGKPLEEERPVPTFAAFAEEYLAHKEKLGYDTWRDRDAIAHLTPVFGARLLTEIDREAVEGYVTQRLAERGKRRRPAKPGAAPKPPTPGAAPRPVRPGTVQKEVNVLRAAYNQAIRWGRVEKNPAAKVTVKGASQHPERLLSPEETGRLLEACPALLRDLVETALLTGMRRGELLALEERDCDFLREEVRVRESKNGDPRTIPMHPRAKEVLWARVRGVEDGRIFPLGNVGRPFREAVKAAKVRDLRFHDLRHCAAGHLFMAGADPRTVMQVLGHRDPRMTLRVYASVTQAHVREAIRRLPAPGRVTHSSQSPAGEKAKAVSA